MARTAVSTHHISSMGSRGVDFVMILLLRLAMVSALLLLLLESSCHAFHPSMNGIGVSSSSAAAAAAASTKTRKTTTLFLYRSNFASRTTKTILHQEPTTTATTDSSVSEPASSSASSSSSSLPATASKDSNVTNIWQNVPQGPPDAILGIAQAYRQCTDPRKVNICVGAYRDDAGQPWVLPSVAQAEQRMMEQGENKEYLPIEGDAQFVDLALQFAYGNSNNEEETKPYVLAGVQTLSGTGACRIGGEFLAKFWPGRPIYLPSPTWGNHVKIFQECGLQVKWYRYYDASTNRLDLAGLLQDLNEAPEGSIILLHACAHNPTGCDPTMAEWEQVTAICKQRRHVIFFDSAYQGFASGNAEVDAQPLRYVVSQGLPVLLAQSFAKNFGLYGERCGTLSVVCANDEQKERIISQLRSIIRPMYSSPPKHGSSIVRTVLSDPELRAQYYQECASMAKRIQTMRFKLWYTLRNEIQSRHDWSHVTSQIGMFAFTGMSPDMCDALTTDHAIYLTRDGRISMAGLNDDNLLYVAQAIHAVTDGKSITTTTTSLTQGQQS